ATHPVARNAGRDPRRGVIKNRGEYGRRHHEHPDGACLDCVFGPVKRWSIRAHMMFARLKPPRSVYARLQPQRLRPYDSIARRPFHETFGSRWHRTEHILLTKRSTERGNRPTGAERDPGRATPGKRE